MGIPEAARALLELGERIALSSPGDGTVDEQKREEARLMRERSSVQEGARTCDQAPGDGA